MWIWANVSSSDPSYVNDSQLTTLGPGSQVLFSIDSSGALASILHTDGFIFNTFKFTGEQDLIWVKTMVRSYPIQIGDSIFGSNNGQNQAVYVATSPNGQIEQVVEGPTTDRPFTTHMEVHIADGYIYDISRFTDNFNYRSFDSNLPVRDFPGSMHVVYTQTPFVLKPKAKPILSIVPTSCSTVGVTHTRTNAEHYTLLVATDSLNRFPQNGENYNYSYDYLRAFPLGKRTKIVHQGSDTTFSVYNLVAGRRYYFTMVPGNGPAGATVYNRDSVDTLSIFIPKSGWQDSLAISPLVDTGICSYDTLNFEGKSPFALRWMDGKSNSNRTLEVSGAYYFITMDEQKCVLSSDTVQLSVYEPPIISKLAIASEAPYCQGDTVVVQARSNGNYLWQDGSSDTLYRATETGFYELTSLSPLGCETIQSIEVTIGNYPSFRFESDSIIGYDGSITVNYRSNADSLNWLVDGDTLARAPTQIQESGLLLVHAFAKGGCSIKDSIALRNYNLPPSIFPNAFSPNGDGVNDVWYFIHPDTLGELTIYDRWGAVVHKGNSIWDGKKLGQELPIGTYEYVFKYLQNGKEQRHEGSIYLLR